MQRLLIPCVRPSIHQSSYPSPSSSSAYAIHRWPAIMLSLRSILALLLLFFTAAAALPGPKIYKKNRPGQPWAACDIKSGDPRDSYTLRGSNWNITEAELKAALNSPAGTVVTRWEWKSGVKEHDPRVQTFEAKVRFMVSPPASMELSSFTSCSDADVSLLCSSGCRFTSRRIL